MEFLSCKECGDELMPNNKGQIHCYYCQKVLNQLCAELDWYRLNSGPCPTSVYDRAGRVKITWQEN